MLTTVCLVRHGETDWNREGRLQGREDVALNEIGREQAGACGSFLRQFDWNRIVSSPLSRAKETAVLIGKAVGVDPVAEIADLAERDYGAASGLRTEEVAMRFPTGAVPGLESREALAARAVNSLSSIARQHQGQRVIVVTHGGVINAILASLSKGAIGSGKTKLENGCINIVELHGNAWMIERYNWTGHLATAAIGEE